MGETFDVIFATCISLLALAATVQLKQKTRPNCSPGMRCTTSLGKAGIVDLPATIAFQTAHKTYFSCLPPSGYALALARCLLICRSLAVISSWCPDAISFDPRSVGGEASFVEDDEQLDSLWELVDEGADSVSLRSFHGTYLSSDETAGAK
jgi:hypothetical protein